MNGRKRDVTKLKLVWPVNTTGIGSKNVLSPTRPKRIPAKKEQLFALRKANREDFMFGRPCSYILELTHSVSPTKPASSLILFPSLWKFSFPWNSVGWFIFIISLWFRKKTPSHQFHRCFLALSGFLLLFAFSYKVSNSLCSIKRKVVTVHKNRKHLH